MTAIIPLTTFSCKCYKLGNWNSTIKLHSSIQLIEIGTSNLSLLVDYVTKHKNKLDCLIVPEVTNIANLIKNENILVYGLLQNNNRKIVSQHRPLTVLPFKPFTTMSTNFGIIGTGVQSKFK